MKIKLFLGRKGFTTEHSKHDVLMAKDQPDRQIAQRHYYITPQNILQVTEQLPKDSTHGHSEIAQMKK